MNKNSLYVHFTLLTFNSLRYENLKSNDVLHTLEKSFKLIVSNRGGYPFYSSFTIDLHYVMEDVSY